MKKITICLILILLSNILECNALYTYPDIQQYEEYLIRNLKYKSYFDSNCSDFLQINNALTALKNHGFFDKNNIGSGEYFNMFKSFSYFNKPTNIRMRGLFPYVNDSYLDKGNGLYLSCFSGDTVFQAGGFQVRGTIILETYDIIFDNYDINEDAKNRSFPLKITKIYIKANNIKDNNLLNTPYYKDGKIFLGCSTNQIQYISPHFAYIKKVFSGNNSLYQVNQRFYLEGEKDQELTQYSGESITINFYVEPSILTENSALECENSWMLKYEVI